MRILFINNQGSGFADYLTLEPETTVKQLFDAKIKSDPAGYLIRVNRQPCPEQQVLQEGDRVSITAVKIEGAC